MWRARRFKEHQMTIAKLLFKQGNNVYFFQRINLSQLFMNEVVLSSQVKSETHVGEDRLQIQHDRYIAKSSPHLFGTLIEPQEVQVSDLLFRMKQTSTSEYAVC